MTNVTTDLDGPPAADRRVPGGASVAGTVDRPGLPDTTSTATPAPPRHLSDWRGRSPAFVRLSGSRAADDPRPRWDRGWFARPITVLLWGFPLWWALGASAGGWAVAALVMLGWLVRTDRRLVVPPAFGWWLLFLCWVFLSALTLESGGRFAAAFYRAVSYLAGTVFLLYVLNTGERLLPTRVVSKALTALWGWSVGLGLVGLAVPNVQWTSVVERALPASVNSIDFVHALVHPRFATKDALIGVARPTPLFQYTNSWGSVVGLLLPVAIWYALGAKKRTSLLLWGAIVVSAVPVVVSINRGLWVSVLVAVAYVLLRRLGRGDLRAAAALVAGAGLAALAVVATPLGTVIIERLHASNSSTRETLYQASIQQVAKSPVLGFGSPTSSAGIFDSNSVSVGTHGQFWTVLVSQGIPGEIFFVGFFIAVIVTTWRVSDRGLWLHAVLVVALVQLPFYDLLPAGIAIWGAVVALCLRDARAAPRRLARGSGPGGRPAFAAVPPRFRRRIRPPNLRPQAPRTPVRRHRSRTVWFR